MGCADGEGSEEGQVNRKGAVSAEMQRYAGMAVDRDVPGTLFGEGVRIGKLIAPGWHRAFYERAFPNREWSEQALALSRKHCPSTVEFMEGVAQGVGVEFSDLFDSWFEELDDAPVSPDRGCTDVAVLTLTGDVLIAHTNDVGPDAMPVLANITVRGRPTVTMIFSHGGPSLAVNGAGIVFSGNQVDSNDVRPGIPRAVLYVEACWSRSIEEAAKVFLNKDRASSYHNLLADQTGRVIGYEASAEKAVALTMKNGVLVHTNHYLGIAGVESREGEGLDGSVARLYRALMSVRSTRTIYGDVSATSLLRLMHTHGDGGLCRHGYTDTAFSVLFFPKDRMFLYGPGHPCETDYFPVRY